MTDMNNDQILTAIHHIVSERGCRVIDIDLENQIINIEGPEDAKLECALAIEAILGQG